MLMSYLDALIILFHSGLRPSYRQPPFHIIVCGKNGRRHDHE